MTLGWDDAVDVLSKCASYDNRTVSEFNVAAWLESLQIGGVTSKDDAMRAVAIHHARHADTWCQPGHVIAIVKEIRKERLASADRFLPDVNPDDVPAWLAARRAGIAALANGDIEPLPTAPVEIDDRVRAALPGLLRRPPRVVAAIEGGPRPVPVAPSPTVPESAVADLEAERARQLAGLKAMGVTS